MQILSEKEHNPGKKKDKLEGKREKTKNEETTKNNFIKGSPWTKYIFLACTFLMKEKVRMMLFFFQLIGMRKNITVGT